MFSGLKDLMQTVGTDWKIADLAPSMAALDSMKGRLLGLYEKVAQNATPVSYYAWQDQGVHVEACTYPLHELRPSRGGYGAVFFLPHQSADC